MGVAGYAHFLALAQRAQWDENAVELTLDGWDDERRALLANLCLAETAVAHELDPIIAAAPPDARACLEVQQRDERRHARFFARYAARIETPEPDPEWRELFEERLPAAARSGSLRQAVGLYHLVLEGTVLARALRGLDGVAGAERVLRDERWHVGLGVRLLSDAGVPQREILAALRGMIETREIGGAEPALVFLHEGLGSVALWRDFPDRLAEATGRRALIYSRAGHGESPVPGAPRTPRFMHDEALDVLPALLERHGIERPVLVGHSDGGSIALIHAAEHPVAALVVLAPHVFVEEESVAGIAQARETFETTGLRDRMARYHRDPEATFRLWNDIWLAPEFRDWNIEEVLGAIRAPVLAIQGTHDQYGTLAQIDAIEAGVRGPFERLVVDAGHAPHLEAPEETLQAAAEFVLR